MRKISLILSGGAMYGACEASALEELCNITDEENIDLESIISAVYGSSIGSINAAAFIQYLGLRMDNPKWMSEVYSKFNISDMIKCDGLDNELSLFDRKNIIPFLKEIIASGKFSLDTLKDYINKMISMDIINDSNIDMRIVVTRRLHECVIYDKKSIDNLADVISSSCALPFIFKRGIIDNKKYSDGGIVNGMPISDTDKCDDIFVMHLPTFQNTLGLRRAKNSGEFNVTIINSDGKINEIYNHAKRNLVVYEPTLSGGFLNPKAIPHSLMVGKNDMQMAKDVIKERILRR